jgi:hypothetical protein
MGDLDGYSKDEENLIRDQILVSYKIVVTIEILPFLPQHTQKRRVPGTRFAKNAQGRDFGKATARGYITHYWT